MNECFRRQRVAVGSMRPFDVLRAGGVEIYVPPGAYPEFDPEPWRDDPSLLMHEASE